MNGPFATGCFVLCERISIFQSGISVLSIDRRWRQRHLRNGLVAVSRFGPTNDWRRHDLARIRTVIRVDVPSPPLAPEPARRHRRLPIWKPVEDAVRMFQEYPTYSGGSLRREKKVAVRPQSAAAIRPIAPDHPARAFAALQPPNQRRTAAVRAAPVR